MARWLALPLAFLFASAAFADQVVDGIAAQVGSEIVLISEVTQVAAPAEAQLRKRGASDADIARLRAEVLERMIERALIRQVVKRAELDATEAEVDDAVDAIAKENGLTLEQLRESVEAQGMPFDVYRERIRSEIEQSKVVNGMVASKVHVEDAEVRALYRERFADQPTGGDELHVRHLLVTFDPEQPATRAAACAQVRQALGRIRAGEPFEAVASEVSEVAPERGGDIGWLHTRSLAEWMRPTVESLEAGQTSDVLETPFGCNLLQVVEKRSYQPISYDDARDPLRRQLFNERMSTEYARFLENLRSKTYIERKGIFADAARLDPGVPDPTERPGESDTF